MSFSKDLAAATGGFGRLVAAGCVIEGEGSAGKG